MTLDAVMKIQNFSNKISVSTAVTCAAPSANILPDQKNPTNHQNHPMHTKTSNQSSKAWRAIAAFCVLVMLALLPTSSFATVKSYRVLHKNNTNVTHHWTFEGNTPLNDKRGTSALIKNPNTGAPEIVGGYNPADSKALLLSGTNGYNNLLANGDPNAVYFGTNIAFEVVFRADQAVHTADAGVAWILNTRSDDNNRRGYLLFQGELGAAPGGTGLASVVGNSFGNVANGNRVANALVAGHWYYVAGSYDTVAGGTTTMTHYIADLTAGETTLTVVGPVTTPAGSTAPVNEHVRLGIGNRYDGVANYFKVQLKMLRSTAATRWIRLTSNRSSRKCSRLRTKSPSAAN